MSHTFARRRSLRAAGTRARSLCWRRGCHGGSATRRPPPRVRSRCSSARPTTPTTSTRSSAGAAPRTRSSTSTTTSSWVTAPTCRRAPSWPPAGRPRPTARSGRSICARGSVAGRRAVHRGGRRVHLHVHHRERSHRLHELHQQHREGRGARRLHRHDDLQQAQGQHAAAVDPPSSPSTSGARCPASAPVTTTSTSRRSSAPAPSRPSR